MLNPEKIYLVTGGTSGVGKATAIGLATKGAKVVLVSRHEDECQSTLDEIYKRTGNNKGDYLIADLLEQASIKNLADAFKRKYNNLYLLANCVGGIFQESKLTDDGIERTFALDYMSHFLLSHELLDILRASGSSRIITVIGSPLLLRNPSIDFNDLQCTSHYSALKAATNAMYCRLYFSFELARRLKGEKISANAFFPGSIKSKLTSHLAWYLKIAGKVSQIFGKEVCDVSTYLGTSDELDGVSGKFFNSKRKIVPLNTKYAPKIGTKLWERTEELIVTN